MDVPCVPSSVVRGCVEPHDEVAKISMVKAGRMLSGGHRCTSWRSGQIRGSREE